MLKAYSASLYDRATQTTAQTVIKFMLLGGVGSVLLGGCSALQKLPVLPSPPPKYVDHLKRSAKHIGIYSHVEKTNQDANKPHQYQLRVEGNSLVPTLDVERYFQEEAQHTCDALTPIKPLHIIEQQKKITNTWQGSVYEIIGTFKCEELAKESPPPVSPPSSLPLFDFSLIEKKSSTESKTTSKTKKINKKRVNKKRKSKGCNCNPADKTPATPSEPAKSAPSNALPRPLPATPTPPALAPNSRAT